MPRLVVGCTMSVCGVVLPSPMLGKFGNSWASADSAVVVGRVTVTLILSLGFAVGRNSVVVFSLKSSLLTLSLVNLTLCFPELTEMSGTARLGIVGEDFLNVSKNSSTEGGSFSSVCLKSESERSLKLNLKLSLETALFTSAPVFFS